MSKKLDKKSNKLNIVECETFQFEVVKPFILDEINSNDYLICLTPRYGKYNIKIGKWPSNFNQWKVGDESGGYTVIDKGVKLFNNTKVNYLISSVSDKSIVSYYYFKKGNDEYSVTVSCDNKNQFETFCSVHESLFFRNMVKSIKSK